MPDAQQQLIIFTRYPRPGKAKTRLIPELGAHGAAALQRRLTERVVATARQLPAGRHIFFEGGRLQTMQRWLGRDAVFHPQAPGDLGSRMRHAFVQVFAAGAGQVVLVGSDIPGISADILRQAFAHLKGRDVVLGPAADGGYYLIGLRRETFRHACRVLFGGIPWGSAAVLKETLAAAHACALSTALLHELRDIDRPQDLAAWEGSPHEQFKR